jgi:hypothetical protein
MVVLERCSVENPSHSTGTVGHSESARHVRVREDTPLPHVVLQGAQGDQRPQLDGTGVVRDELQLGLSASRQQQRTLNELLVDRGEGATLSGARGRLIAGL